MKNKIIAICFCALALIIALVFCDIQLKSEAASEDVRPYAEIIIGGEYTVTRGNADEIEITDYGTVKIKINRRVYETAWCNLVIRWD